MTTVDTQRSNAGRPVREVPSLTAIALTYRIVLRQLTSRGRIIALTLLAMVAPVAGWALGSSDASLNDAVRLIASIGLGLVIPVVALVFGGAAILTGAGSGIVTGTFIAGCVGVTVYVAVFTFLGTWLKRFIVWGLAYILIWEGFVAQAGPGVAQVVLRKYTRSILVEQTGVDLDLADFSLAVGIIVPLFATVVALALAAWRLGAQDID